MGIAIGCCLHLFLSLGGFPDFSLIMTGLYFSFAPIDAFENEQETNIALSIMSMALVLAATSRYWLEFRCGTTPELAEFVFGLVTLLTCSSICFLLFVRNKLATSLPAKNDCSVVVSVCFSIWCMFPYIGLSNQGNLTMFSNLITLSHRSNHLVVDTSKTKIFGFEEDYVEIAQIDPFGRFHHGQDITRSFIPLVSFSRSVELWKKHNSVPKNIVFIHKNETYTAKDLDQFLPKNAFASKYLLFRMTPKEGPMKTCW